MLALLAGLWLALWVLVALVENARYIHEPQVPWARIVVPATTAALAAAVWLLGWLGSGGFGRIALDRPWRWFLRAFAFAPVLGAAETVVVHGSRILIFSAMKMPYFLMPLQALIPYEIVKVGAFYALWLGLAFGVKTFAAWQEQTRNLLDVQKALAEAQLSQLKRQLQPHFLFNTLNTISSLMHSDVARADSLIARLADLLRVSLNLGERDLIPLEEELRFARQYAAIMCERFGDRVTLAWDIPDALLRAPVPALMLQPLVENAFRHGVEKSAGPQTIVVQARADAGQLVLSVLSTGGGPATGADGIGLRNCRERLLAHYGAEAALVLEPAAGGGTVVAVSLPWEPD